jgi:hypothetical protein
MQPLELHKTKDGPDIEVVAKEVKVASADELLKQVDDLGEQLRLLIVASKKVPRDKSLEPHQEQGRALSLAQAYLQTGFMWLRRAIAAPKEF